MKWSDDEEFICYHNTNSFSSSTLLKFSGLGKNILDGQIFTIFIIVLAAAEAAVALAIIINLYKNYDTVNVDEANTLKG